MNLLIIFLVALVILTAILIFLSMHLSTLNKIKRFDTTNVVIKNNTVYLDTLTTKQKLSQMMVVSLIFFGNSQKDFYTRMNVGGIYPQKQSSPEGYKNLIQSYQDSSKIKLFVTADLEGYWSPFSKKFGDEYQFPAFSDINGTEEAYSIGLQHGETLKRLGFNLNFAPVSEFSDKAYGGRVFLGNKETIKKKLKAYIEGLQKNAMGTCKHYPGRGMIGNTHLKRDKQNITKEDLELFETCIEANISSIMVGHQIVRGEADSKSKPSSVSPEVIGDLKNFKGLIISDEVNMLGLRTFYRKKEDMYRDLINAGNDLILDFSLTPTSMHRLVEKLEKKVESGEISEAKINESVRKILKAKGYKVVG